MYVWLHTYIYIYVYIYTNYIDVCVYTHVHKQNYTYPAACGKSRHHASPAPQVATVGALLGRFGALLGRLGALVGDAGAPKRAAKRRWGGEWRSGSTASRKWSTVRSGDSKRSLGMEFGEHEKQEVADGWLRTFTIRSWEWNSGSTRSTKWRTVGSGHSE